MATGTIPNKLDLVWTNPSPTSTFAAQTVSIDLSKYSFVWIQFSVNSTGTNPNSFTALFPVNGDSFQTQASINVSGNTGSPCNCVTRIVTPILSGVTFSSGYQKFTNVDNTQPTVADNRAVPLYIWAF